MKPFEIIYALCEPGLPVLYNRVRKTLRSIAKSSPTKPRILDIGGRKSHYTIGIPASITVTDLPRTSAIQHQLHLGIDEQMVDRIRLQRSNIEQVLIDDMTRSSLGSDSFDCAVAVEVLEHVEDDATFVREVRRVLKSNGTFLMTTPNGDFVKNTNPDHKRHYRRDELEVLLRQEFRSVDVRYAIPGTKYYNMALRSWSLKRPLGTLMTYLAGMINSLEDRFARPATDGAGMQELIAVARKSVDIEQPVA
jgi:SAM-dependent methyltransferase